MAQGRKGTTAKRGKLRKDRALAGAQRYKDVPAKIRSFLPR